ncbi:MAG: ATP-binding protein [Bacteroidota bacterium]
MNVITTNKKWDDILPAGSVQKLLQMLDGCREKTQPVQTNGLLPCLSLFYGAAKENKIAAAGLIASQINQPAYRIDTHAIVSKYIGETEKNLEKVFAKAENSGWILFFDEADALFGKRTGIKDSHDKYGNAETGYLMQRIKKYLHPVIVAVDNRDIIPPAALQCFHSSIEFRHIHKG